MIFAHGGGSSRLSPRDAHAAARLRARGFATLLFDLLTPGESADRRNVFDISLLASRVGEAIGWARAAARTAALRIGLFGASTGARAAIAAAAAHPEDVDAVVSRGGRPDLAGDALERVEAATLLIAGGEDHHAIASLARPPPTRVVIDIWRRVRVQTFPPLIVWKVRRP